MEEFGENARLRSVAPGLTLLEPFGQDLSQVSLDGRFGVDQPLKVLAGQSEQPTGFGTPDGGETGVTIATSPVAGGEFTEVITGSHGADEPGLDEDVEAAGQDDIEKPVRISPADDL